MKDIQAATSGDTTGIPGVGAPAPSMHTGPSAPPATVGAGVYLVKHTATERPDKAPGYREAIYAIERGGSLRCAGEILPVHRWQELVAAYSAEHAIERYAAWCEMPCGNWWLRELDGVMVVETW